MFFMGVNMELILLATTWMNLTSDAGAKDTHTHTHTHTQINRGVMHSLFLRGHGWGLVIIVT